ncbi:MAG: hypothetical protein ACPH9F_06370 [Candidatus Poseidoniaceae archaeon]
MVLIECPHCEEHIELDDDAAGLFACPHCDGEFEWGEKESGSDAIREYASTDHDHFLSRPATRITVGAIVATVFGILGIITGIGPILWGAIFSDLGAGGLGAFLILTGLFFFAVGGFGIFVGVMTAKGKIWALVTGFILSVLLIIIQLLGWLVSEDTCAEIDFWTGECVETYSEPFPVFGFLIFITLAGCIGTLLFHPAGRYQFD